MRRILAAGLCLAALLIFPCGAPALGPGKIEGRVSAPGAVEDVEVCVVEQQPSEICTYPAANGTYRLTGLDLGPQKVEFLPSYRSHYLPQYFDHKSSLAEAATISLTQTLPSAMDIDATLELGGVIEGQISADVSGAALAGVEVCAFEVGTRTPAGCTETNSGGAYSIPGLARSSYKIGFWGEGPSAAYAPEFYADEPIFAQATPVAVTPGVTQNGIDAQLAMGASVSGTVSDFYSARPLADIAVCLLKAGDAGLERCTATDERGEYALPGITAGSYEVVFSPEFGEFAGDIPILLEDDGYRTQYYDEATTFVDAAPISLFAPTPRTGINGRLVSSQAIPPPTPPTTNPGSPVPAAIFAEPPMLKRPAKRCRRGYRQRVVKGQVRCVKKARWREVRHAHGKDGQ